MFKEAVRGIYSTFAEVAKQQDIGLWLSIDLEKRPHCWRGACYRQSNTTVLTQSCGFSAWRNRYCLKYWCYACTGLIGKPCRQKHISPTPQPWSLRAFLHAHAVKPMFFIIVIQIWTDRDIGDMILNLLKNMFRHTLDSACTSIWSYKVQVKHILRVHFRIDCNTLMPRGLFEWLHKNISFITLTCVKWSRLGNPITLMNMQCTACDNILALWSVNVTVIAPVMWVEVARKYFNQTKGQIIITCVTWLEMLPVTYLNCIRNGVSFASRLHKAIEIIYIYIYISTTRTRYRKATTPPLLSFGLVSLALDNRIDFSICGTFIQYSSDVHLGSFGNSWNITLLCRFVKCHEYRTNICRKWFVNTIGYIH